MGSLVDTSVTNLNNSGLPFGPGDYTGAWQWDLVIGAGESATVSSSFGTTPPAEVPEPSSYALVSLGVGLMAALRFRR